ncbi:MAG TPA: hypothetical protein VF981_10685 [Gemmatimonadaceae bacterium]
MSGINMGKVFVGGLVAAVVFFVIDGLTYGVVMKDAFDANTVRLGLDPAAMTGAASVVAWVVMELIWGVLVVWTYAAIRPRLGPGPKTAAMAGLIPYIAVLSVMSQQTLGGMMPVNLFWQGAVFALVSIMAGSIAGAWVYKEA